jgi:hypothetical protein
MKILNDLTAEYVRSILDYNPDSGVFTWKKTRANRAKKGAVAGHRNSKGYLAIRINYVSYQGYRLAWLIMTGNWPECEIDHRDMDPSNNKWENLRQASHNQNKHNRGKNKNNTSGFKGVFWNNQSKKWFSQIACNRKTIYLGIFDTKEKASIAYCKAAEQYHHEFARIAQCL